MDTSTILQTIQNTNWNYFSGPEFYQPKNMISALTNLVLLNDEHKNKDTYDTLLSTMGNNHAGEYYPAIQAALPIIIQVALEGNSEIAKNCAFNILTDIMECFSPEVGTYHFISEADLKLFVTNSIQATRQKFIDVLNEKKESNRNAKLIKDLFDI